MKENTKMINLRQKTGLLGIFRFTLTKSELRYIFFGLEIDECHCGLVQTVCYVTTPQTINQSSVFGQQTAALIPSYKIKCRTERFIPAG